MTADEFRELALSLAGVTEGFAHTAHPDFLRAWAHLCSRWGIPMLGGGW